MTAAIAGASAPYIAEIIGHHAGINNNDAAKVAAHAVANAVLASLQGQDALAGAAGAATGELTGILAMQMYGKPVSELSETDKQTISALATVAAGIAGGIAGDSTAAAVAGAQAGKTTVENNALGAMAGSGLGFWLGKTPDCDATCKADIAKGVAEGNLVVSAGIATVAGGAVIVGATPEIAAAAKAALEGCAASPVICLNNAGLQVAEAVTPGGVGAAGAIGVGKTAAEAAAAKAEATAVSAAKNGGKGTSVSSGAENIATYPKLKDELIQQNLNNIAKQDPILAAVVKGDNGKLNYGVGSGTKAEADRLGKIWVGDGSRLLTDGKGWISADGTRVYRFPAPKPNTPQDLNPTGMQANFETLKNGKKISNGHMGIIQ